MTVLPLYNRIDHPSSTLDNLYAFGASVKEGIYSTTEKVKAFVSTPEGKFAVGCTLGVAFIFIYSPLTERILEVLGCSALPDPFGTPHLVTKILLAPLVCIAAPFFEEFLFRGVLQEGLTATFQTYFEEKGFSEKAANIAARISSIFVGAIIFGLVHFTNALLFWCNPVLFLPQVIAATLIGIALGFAKEFSGDLCVPVGMHFSNNTIAYIKILVS